MAEESLGGGRGSGTCSAGSHARPTIRQGRRFGRPVARLDAALAQASRGVRRCLALSPQTANYLEEKAMIRLAQGDLAGARALLRRNPAVFPRTICW